MHTNNEYAIANLLLVDRWTLLPDFYANRYMTDVQKDGENKNINRNVKKI